jgi:hypothetical protein
MFCGTGDIPQNIFHIQTVQSLKTLLWYEIEIVNAKYTHLTFQIQIKVFDPSLGFDPSSVASINSTHLNARQIQILNQVNMYIYIVNCKFVALQWS